MGAVVAIEVIKVYHVEAPDNCLDPIAWAYNLQSTWIQKHGSLQAIFVDSPPTLVDDDDECATDDDRSYGPGKHGGSNE